MSREIRSQLQQYTSDLLALNKEAEDYYLDVVRRHDSYEPDFFGKVKPFADRVAAVREQWLPAATAFVQKERPLHLHPSQLQQTAENLEIVAIKSFYKQTSLKRQMETFKSVEYVLNQLLDAISTAEGK